MRWSARRTSTSADSPGAGLAQPNERRSAPASHRQLPGHRLADPFHVVDRRHLVGLGQDHAEAGGPDAEAHVAGPGLAAQRLGGLAQSVAGDVLAHLVAQLHDALDLEHDDRHRAAVACGPGHLGDQRALPRVGALKTGQGVSPPGGLGDAADLHCSGAPRAVIARRPHGRRPVRRCRPRPSSDPVGRSVTSRLVGGGPRTMVGPGRAREPAAPPSGWPSAARAPSARAWG